MTLTKCKRHFKSCNINCDNIRYANSASCVYRYAKVLNATLFEESVRKPMFRIYSWWYLWGRSLLLDKITFSWKAVACVAQNMLLSPVRKPTPCHRYHAYDLFLLYIHTSVQRMFSNTSGTNVGFICGQTYFVDPKCSSYNLFYYIHI